MKNIIKDTLILFAITLVAGLGLGLVYNVTANSRAMQEEKTKIEAYNTVMPGLGSFDNVSFDSVSPAPAHVLRPIRLLRINRKAINRKRIHRGKLQKRKSDRSNAHEPPRCAGAGRSPCAGPRGL